MAIMPLAADNPPSDVVSGLGGDLAAWQGAMTALLKKTDLSAVPGSDADKVLELRTDFGRLAERAAHHGWRTPAAPAPDWAASVSRLREFLGFAQAAHAAGTDAPAAALDRITILKHDA